LRLLRGTSGLDIAASKTEEGAMADHTPMEIKAHEQTYTGFIKAFTYGALACFVIAAIVVYLIAS
jgi:Bacterial aa3 type cytochrome c oxidase subunit IV